PARMIINEAHAWVEVYDGVLWRRIDLGGAGRMVNPASNVMPERAVHQAPPDPFAWPQGSERGDEMVEQARARARQEQEQAQAQSSSSASSSSSAGPMASGGAMGGDGGGNNPFSSGTSDPLGPAPGGDGGGSSGPSPSGTNASGAPGTEKDDRPIST